ncbi:MAG: AraC family transcriptional regulator [Prevotellaceae bacterium]|jgi:AraC-like DNA-binding protein|nr:AraC family transcriptional regulator [Prevotellaceae bacterium]
MNGINIINYSDVFLACFSGNAIKKVNMAKDHSLLYVYSGEMEVTEQGKTALIGKGECVFIRKDNRVNIVKRPKGDEQYKCIALTLTRPFLREFYHRTLDKSELPTDALRHQFSLHKLPADRPDIRSLFESMTPYFDSPIPPTDELIKLKMTEGIYCLLNTDKNFYSALFDFSEPWKIDILDYLNENYMYDLSPKDMANFTGRSLATFKRDFKKISNLSPQKWLIRKRLEVAQQKLSNGDKKVSDVCYEVGFKNLSHFSKLYKATFGTAPSK